MYEFMIPTRVFMMRVGERMSMGYPKYAWVGNRISRENMEVLYKLKVEIRKPITKMVAEAVELYISTLNKREKE
ncbi:MAG: hypothetical protein DWB56_07965 [Candidatus Jettenia sp.]|nr:MAG: hypothetical protein EDM77_03450 [Candidatus Jettenia sp. AMX1]MBC6928881.1 hypothetical protein [Candidatus Jettenia sp.]MCE7879882.1 hypothetical protein [Candidatus Jettenia sp. AMX1]MCQ3926661.1 hypothetical protein [Candidatus Jettenia sp.]